MATSRRGLHHPSRQPRQPLAVSPEEPEGALSSSQCWGVLLKRGPHFCTPPSPAEDPLVSQIWGREEAGIPGPIITSTPNSAGRPADVGSACASPSLSELRFITPACTQAPQASRTGLRPRAMRPQAPVRTLSCLVNPKNHKATKPGSHSLLLSSPQPQARLCHPSSYHGSGILLKRVSPHTSLLQTSRISTALRTQASSSLSPSAPPAPSPHPAPHSPIPATPTALSPSPPQAFAPAVPRPHCPLTSHSALLEAQLRHCRRMPREHPRSKALCLVLGAGVQQ